MKHACRDCGVDLHPPLCGVCYQKRLEHIVEVARTIEIAFDGSLAVIKNGYALSFAIAALDEATQAGGNE